MGRWKARMEAASFWVICKGVLANATNHSCYRKSRTRTLSTNPSKHFWARVAETFSSRAGSREKKMTVYQQPLLQFVVRVGYWEVRVKAHDGDEAIRLARLQMA